MKREFLEQMGLEKEAIDKIMAENGNDIEAEKSKVIEVTKERDTLQNSLNEANKTIKSYKDMKIEEIQKSAADWEAKANERAEELENVRRDLALDKALMGSETVDTDLLKKVLDMDALSFKEGVFIGLNGQLEQIKKDRPFLFKASDPEPKGAQEQQNSGSQYEPFVPKAKDGESGQKSEMQMQIEHIFN